MQTLIIFILLIISHSFLAVLVWALSKGAPPKPKPDKSKANMEGEIQKLNTILKNIEVYDGSPKGQVKP